MPTFKLTLEYDGTNYCGWQRQPNGPTIQAVLEETLERIARTPLHVIGAARTDAGVHALGQVVGFQTDRSLSAHDWRRALNGLLPDDIAVVAAEEVPEGFHARYAATGKLYEYRILHRPDRSALERTRAWHIYGSLDLPAMQQAAQHLLGRHDCSSFQGHPTDTQNPVCTITRLDFRQAPPMLLTDVQADRFLKQMVRAMVGTLVEVGQGRRKPEEMQAILEAKDRRAAGLTAPAHGLYLVRVAY
jgi:tRNA pseudouridine38-40 synthase